MTNSKVFSLNKTDVEQVWSEMKSDDIVFNLPVTIWILVGQFFKLLMDSHLLDDIFVM